MHCSYQVRRGSGHGSVRGRAASHRSVQGGKSPDDALSERPYEADDAKSVKSAGSATHRRRSKKLQQDEAALGDVDEGLTKSRGMLQLLVLKQSDIDVVSRECKNEPGVAKNVVTKLSGLKTKIHDMQRKIEAIIKKGDKNTTESIKRTLINAAHVMKDADGFIEQAEKGTCECEGSC